MLIPDDPAPCLRRLPGRAGVERRARAARRADAGGQGHLRRRRLRHRLRQPREDRRGGAARSRMRRRSRSCSPPARASSARRTPPNWPFRSTGETSTTARRSTRPRRIGSPAARRPVRPRRSPGGLVDIALGSDTGGSVRGPASFCGIIGLRPTHGRVDIAGAMPLAPSLDTVGWFAREIEVFAAVGGVLLGEDDDGPPLTQVVIAEDAFAFLDDDARGVLDPLVRRVARALSSPRTVQMAPGRPRGLARRLPHPAGLRGVAGAWRVGRGAQARPQPRRRGARFRRQAR